MICIRKPTLSLIFLLAGTQSNSYAFKVKSAYEKESYIQKETADNIAKVTKPVLEIKFEPQLLESIVYSQSGPYLRADLIKNIADSTR